MDQDNPRNINPANSENTNQDNSENTTPANSESISLDDDINAKQLRYEQLFNILMARVAVITII